MQSIKCPNCGYISKAENPYYSKDYASVFWDAQKLHIFWCSNCSYITETKEQKRLALFPYNVSKSFPLNKLFEKDYFNLQMNSLGGLLGFHVHRMIWHSIDDRSRFENGKAHNEKSTIELLFDKLNPLSIATAIWAVSNTRASVSLEDQLEMSIYQKSDILDYALQAQEIISEEKNWQNQKLVLQILKDFLKAI